MKPSPLLPSLLNPLALSIARAIAGVLLAVTPALASDLSAPAPADERPAKAVVAPPWEDLLARHIDWLGGREALERIQSITAHGRLEVSGLSGTFESLQQRPDRMRFSYDLGITKGAQGVSTETAWSMDGSGRVEPMGSAGEAQARREIARAFSRNLFRADGSTISDLGTVEHEGGSWRAVRFAYPDSDFCDLLLAEDGSCTWLRERRDTETCWRRFTDWRVIDGLRVACRIEELHDNPAANQTVTIERLSFNQPIAAELFAPPRTATKLHRIENDAAATAWIPLELFRGSYIYLQGTVNGVQTDLLLDSGAGMTVLDQAFASAHGIESAGTVVARGTGGESTASFAGGLTVRIGELELRDLRAAVIDLGGISAKLGRSMPVILGKEVFHSLVVDIDYPARRLRFLEPADYRYEGPGRRLPLLPSEDGHKDLEISVEGTAPVRVALDTGSGSALDLFGWYVDEKRLLDGRSPISEGLSGGVGGMTSEKLASLREIEIAGFTLPDVPIGMQWRTTGAFATRRIAGNLGAGILKRFRIAFDYAHECLWMEPRPGTETDPFDRNHSGLTLERKPGALEVLFVAPGSPAAAGGWKIGEKIVALNGTPVGDTYTESIDRFGRGPEGTAVALRLEGGEERTLILKRYY